MMWNRALRSFGALLLIGLLAGALYSQPPVPWWENPVAAGLTLTDAQRERITGIARDYRDRLQEKRAEANRAERALQEIFDADVVDNARGQAAIDRLARARADLTRDVSRMTLQMRTVLTGEQWRALQSGRQVARQTNAGGRGKRSPGRAPGFGVPGSGTPGAPSGSGLLAPNR